MYFKEARMMKVLTICKSFAPRSIQIIMTAPNSTSSLNFYTSDALLDDKPNSVNALKAKQHASSLFCHSLSASTTTLC